MDLHHHFVFLFLSHGLIITKNMKKDILQSRFEYFLVFLLIMASGNPIFVASGHTEIMFVALFLLCLMYRDIFKKIIQNQGLMIFCGLFFVLFLIQAIEFDFFSFPTIAGFYIRLLLGFIIFFAIRSGPEKYIKCLYFICVLSLSIFLLVEALKIGAGINLKTYFEPLKFFNGKNYVVHILFYNFDGEGEPDRNSGPFWEPGAFQGYIIIAILLLSAYKDRISSNQYRRRLIVFILTLLSTQSTTGYLLLPLALIPHLNLNTTQKKFASSVVKISVIIFIGILISPKIIELDFLQDKIIHQYKSVVNEQPDWELTRFGTFMFDLRYMEKRPLLGWGINEKTRFGMDGGKAIAGQGNGLTDGVVKFGFIGFGLYVAYLFFSFKRFYGGKKAFAFIALAAVLISLNGEGFLNFPIYWGLIALPRP